MVYPISVFVVCNHQPDIYLLFLTLGGTGVASTVQLVPELAGEQPDHFQGTQSHSAWPAWYNQLERDL